jgi:hypothetical protein
MGTRPCSGLYSTNDLGTSKRAKNQWRMTYRREGQQYLEMSRPLPVFKKSSKDFT